MNHEKGEVKGTFRDKNQNEQKSSNLKKKNFKIGDWWTQDTFLWLYILLLMQ